MCVCISHVFLFIVFSPHYMSAPQEQGLSLSVSTRFRTVGMHGHFLNACCPPPPPLVPRPCPRLPGHMWSPRDLATICPSGLLSHTSAFGTRHLSPLFLSTSPLPQPRETLSSLGQSCLALTDHVFFQIYYLCLTSRPGVLQA